MVWVTTWSPDFLDGYETAEPALAVSSLRPVSPPMSTWWQR